MTSDQIESTLKQIQSAMEDKVSPEDIDGVQAKLCVLSGYIGTSAECIRYAKQAMLHKQRQVLGSNIGAKHSPNILRQLVESELFYEVAMVDYANRINAGITHTIDALRTVVSLYGKELETQNKVKTFTT